MENNNSKYRHNLPQLSGDIFLTGAGMETTFIFYDHIQIPEFASFTLLNDKQGYQRIFDWNAQFLEIAKKYDVGFVLETATWRANPDWAKKLGYSESDLVQINQKAVKLLCDLRELYETSKNKIVVSGIIGPRGEGYQATNRMTAEEAEQYHLPQIRTLSHTAADQVTAATISYVEEAIGIVRAAKSVGMPVIVSFTTETDGKLPSGMTLKEAIETVDRETGNYAVYFGINCAHPIHFKDVLDEEEAWAHRIRFLRGNSSKKSHAELNECPTLDEGDPVEFGQEKRELLKRFKNIAVIGGCCGTNHLHVEEVGKACIINNPRQKI